MQRLRNSQRADEGSKGWGKKHTGGNRRNKISGELQEVGPCSCLWSMLLVQGFPTGLSGSDPAMWWVTAGPQGTISYSFIGNQHRNRAVSPVKYILAVKNHVKVIFKCILEKEKQSFRDASGFLIVDSQLSQQGIAGTCLSYSICYTWLSDDMTSDKNANKFELKM